jgi:hypothetical protein
MGVNLGAAPITNLKLGETQVDKVYLGDELVWQNAPTPSTIRALKFECDSSQSLGISADYIGELTPNFEYSTDGTHWTQWNNLTMTLPFGEGTPLYVRGMNTVISTGSNYVTFTFAQSDNKVRCSGSVMHLFNYTQDLTEFPADPNSHGIANLFHGCYALEIPPSLPATTLLPYSYESTFSGCTSLIAIPSLPATVLGEQCYRNMFNGCSQIKMSSTQSEEYPNEYVFGANPSGGTYGYRMFRYTGGTFTGSPNRLTYYTANEIIR